MATRNLAVEKQMLNTFIQTRKKKPETPQDWAEVMKMSYPNNDLPTDLQNTSAASLYSAGMQKPVAAPAPAPITPQTAPTPQQNNANLQGQVNDAKAQTDQAFNAYDQMPSGDTAMRILQEAIKAKANPRDFAQAPIGESQIFKQAGVGGFGALGQSLATRGQEIDMNRADFANTVAQMSDAYRSTADAVKRRYEVAADNYKNLTEMLNKNIEQVQQNEQEMNILKQKSALDMQLENLRSSNNIREKSIPGAGDILDAQKSGYIYRNGQLMEDTDLNKGIVNGYNISSYATDPHHEVAIHNIVQNMGQFKTIQDVDSYIHNKYPNSPISGDMVAKASEKYGVPWEMITAMMEQDSSLGTKGYGAKTNNPGNVGTTDERAAAGKPNSFASMQDGVNAVAKWLSNHAVAQKQKDQQDVFKAFDKMTPQKQQRIEARISDYEGSPAVKNYILASEGYRSSQRIKDNTTNPVDDISLVYAFAKAMDPNSVVREGEAATVQKYSQSLASKYGFDVQRVLAGTGIMSESARKNLKKTIAERFKSQEEDYNSIKKESARLINDIVGDGSGEKYLIDHAQAVNEFRDQQKAGDFSLTLPNGKVLRYKNQADLDNAKKKAGL